ncbi:MAG: hypothetical protein K2L63_03120 [Paramuribaculum sp.]|nr:hypothetical protein [Paramuribaculum sp.]
MAMAMLSGVFHTRATVIDMNAMKEWQTRLSQSRNATDSITALYNLFDISLRNDSGVYSAPLVRLTSRTKNFDVMLDVLRKLGNSMRADSMAYRNIRETIAQTPPSEDQYESLLFIDLTRFNWEVSNMSDAQRMTLLQRLINDYQDNPGQSLYDRILPLYRITILLGRTVGGDLYSDYMDRLYLFIKELPDPDGPLSSLFYTQAATAYTFTNEPEKAVTACKRLLEITQNLKERNQKRGYVYANYNSIEYIYLRRMLVNFPALTDKEIEQYCGKLMELVEADERLREEFNHLGRARGYYLVATKRYAEAIPELMKSLHNETDREFRTRVYPMIILSAKESGNQKVLNEISDDYIAMLEEERAARQVEKINELQLLLDINAGSKERIRQINESYINDTRQLTAALVIVSIIAAAATIMLIITTAKHRRRH